MEGELVFYQETEFKDNKIGKIPKEWEVKKLGEVADISAGGSAPQGEIFFGGKNKFIRVSHLDNFSYRVKGFDLITDEAVAKYKLKLFPKDTIVFPKSGATIYLEKRAQLPFDGYIVSHLFGVNSNSDKLFQDYLFYVLISKKLASKKADGYPTLNLSDISNVLIQIPPLEEQKAIAEVLRTIQQAIEKTEEVIKATKDFKKSMMKHLFTYGYVGVGEKDRVKLKQTEIGLIPEHWEVVRLGDTLNRNVHINFKGDDNTDVPFIPMNLIPNNNIYIQLWEIRKLKDIKSGIKVLEGDLLLAKITPSFENGKLGILRNLPNKVAFATTEVIPLRPKSFVYTEFLAYFMSMESVRLQLSKKMEGSTGRKRLPKSQLENLLIPLPPLPEQKAIAEVLQAIDNKIQKEENKKQALENLFKSMLHHLMTGKIRIKQTTEA